jgi:hypothetical protein
MKEEEDLGGEEAEEGGEDSWSLSKRMKRTGRTKSKKIESQLASRSWCEILYFWGSVD